jgi:hypothetical protein
MVMTRQVAFQYLAITAMNLIRLNPLILIRRANFVIDRGHQTVCATRDRNTDNRRFILLLYALRDDIASE